MVAKNWIPEPDDVRAWLEGLGIVVNDTYRVMIDRRTMRMRVWQFVKEDGAFIRKGDQIARRIPFDVALSFIPAFVRLDRYGDWPELCDTCHA